MGRYEVDRIRRAREWVYAASVCKQNETAEGCLKSALEDIDAALEQHTRNFIAAEDMARHGTPT
jgi:hypothetical protein